MYKKGYYKGYTARMEPLDFAGGGAPARGSSGSMNPYNRSGGNTAGKTSTGEVSRMGRWAQVPNTRTPSSLNADNAGWAKAMQRGAMQAAKALLQEFGNMVGEYTTPFAEDWGTLPQKTFNPTGQWTRCANPTDSCAPSASLTLWDWFGSHATNSGVCNLGSCPLGQVSVLGDAIPSMAGWPSTVNLINIGRASATPGRYDHLQQWRRLGPATPSWAIPRPIRPTVPLNGVRPFAKGEAPLKHPVKAPPKVDLDGRVRAKPRVRPSTDIVFPPGRPPVIKTGEHVDEPDKVPTRKVRGVPKAMVGALALMHGLTELGDFVDALYEALPPIARCAGKRGLVHDLICVLEHADAFADPDVMAAAIGNLIANEVEDRVIGALFGSNWRTGVRSFNDQYGGSAWIGGGYGAPTADAGFGGLISWSGSARMSPM